MLGTLAALWGFVGVVAFLGFAIVRLSLVGAEVVNYSLLWYHWVVLLSFSVFMAYSEGYRGFQNSFSPRVAARVKYLYQNPSLTRLILAPLFCMGFIEIARRRQIVIICLTLGVITLIQLVRLLEPIWRSIVDVGVVIGLSWGLVSFIIFTIKAFLSEDFDCSPEVP